MTTGKITLGHTRLAILDLDTRSNQPFCYGNVALVFNGEVWNYQELRVELGRQGQRFTTQGDTEVLAAALSVWGLGALPRLNGMFAIAWTLDGETLYLARDRFGEIPLHVAKQTPFCFASELKALVAMRCHPSSFDDVQPGCYAVVTQTSIQQVPYHHVPLRPIADDRSRATRQVRQLLGRGVAERVVSDVPVCVLISGGIDSAAIAYYLSQHVSNLVAYTAVYNRRSQDLRCARSVAATLGIQLIEVDVPLPTVQDLRRVIEHIEMDYKAQVEIGWACLVLARRMQADGFKVTFSGEGSDELWASYGFAYHALKTQDWHRYRRDLFLSQARKNFARCNKVFMAHSVECRLPFLHPPLVEYAVALRQTAVQDGKARPKAVLQEAFKGCLPEGVIHRPKVAFQDGMGLKSAIAEVIHNPKAFYGGEYRKLYA